MALVALATASFWSYKSGYCKPRKEIYSVDDLEDGKKNQAAKEKEDWEKAEAAATVAAAEKEAREQAEAAAAAAAATAAAAEEDKKKAAVATAVTWAVALKQNNHNKHTGLDAQYCESGNVNCNWSKTNSVDKWLKANLLGRGWDCWVHYNDQFPVISNSAGLEVNPTPLIHKKGHHGHCKGIVAWNDATIGWLVHSSPHWPEAFSNEYLSNLPHSSHKLGQSFAWVTVPRNAKLERGLMGISGIELSSGLQVKPALEAIFDQLIVMEANVYYNPTNGIVPNGYAAYTAYKAKTALNKTKMYVLVLDNTAGASRLMYHVAKSSSWTPLSGCRQDQLLIEGQLYADNRPDIYYDGVRIAFGPMYSRSWIAQNKLTMNFDAEKVLTQKGQHMHDHPYPCDEQVTKVETVILLDRGPEDHKGQRGDHSKWAISKSPHSPPWTLIGDLNRSTAQSDRGGGGIIIVDEGLRRAMGTVLGRPHITGY